MDDATRGGGAMLSNDSDGEEDQWPYTSYTRTRRASPPVAQAQGQTQTHGQGQGQGVTDEGRARGGGGAVYEPVAVAVSAHASISSEPRDHVARRAKRPAYFTPGCKRNTKMVSLLALGLGLFLTSYYSAPIVDKLVEQQVNRKASTQGVCSGGERAGGGRSQRVSGRVGPPCRTRAGRVPLRTFHAPRVL